MRDKLFTCDHAYAQLVTLISYCTQLASHCPKAAAQNKLFKTNIKKKFFKTICWGNISSFPYNLILETIDSVAVCSFPTFFSRSSFSLVQEASYWLFSVVATLSLLFRDSMKAFLLVASSDKVFTWTKVEQRGNRKVKKKAEQRGSSGYV